MFRASFRFSAFEDWWNTGNDRKVSQLSLLCHSCFLWSVMIFHLKHTKTALASNKSVVDTSVLQHTAMKMITRLKWSAPLTMKTMWCPATQSPENGLGNQKIRDLVQAKTDERHHCTPAPLCHDSDWCASDVIAGTKRNWNWKRMTVKCIKSIRPSPSDWLWTELLLNAMQRSTNHTHGKDRIWVLAKIEAMASCVKSFCLAWKMSRKTNFSFRQLWFVLCLCGVCIWATKVTQWQWQRIAIWAKFSQFWPYRYVRPNSIN